MTENLGLLFRNIASGLSLARQQPLKNHEFAKWYRQTAAKAVADSIQRPDLQVHSSVGKGNWAEVAWIGVFNPESTTSAPNGVYVVYLFSADLKELYLCQGQGVTRVKDEFGSGASKELSRRSELMRARVPEHSPKHSSDPVSLRGTSSLARSYEPAIAYYTKYTISDLPGDDELTQDLCHMIDLYDVLIARGGTDNIETAMLARSAGHADDLETINEQRRYTRHLRIERRSTAKVKAVQGYTCQICSFNFQEFYGELGKDYIEAHHLTPLHTLPEGAVVSMNPRTDFAVLCSNCHRMLHRSSTTMALDDLKRDAHVHQLRTLYESTRRKAKERA